MNFRITARVAAASVLALGLAACELPPRPQATASNQTPPKHHHCEYVTGSRLCQDADEGGGGSLQDPGVNNRFGATFGAGASGR